MNYRSLGRPWGRVKCGPSEWEGKTFRLAAEALAKVGLLSEAERKETLEVFIRLPRAIIGAGGSRKLGFQTEEEKGNTGGFYPTAKSHQRGGRFTRSVVWPTGSNKNSENQIKRFIRLPRAIGRAGGSSKLGMAVEGFEPPTRGL